MLNRIMERTAPLVRTTSDVATELLRNAIVDGTLPPGRRLKEEELARSLGISRTPVREALVMLQAEGLVETAPNKGAIVRSHSADELDDLYQLRALLEGHVARRAASHATDELIGKLWASCERFDRLIGDEVSDLVQENLMFHGLILEAAGSERLESIVRNVTELPLVYRSYIWYSEKQRRLSLHYHQQITRALGARDGERAELLMKEHVYEARDVLLVRMRELEGER